MDLLYWLGEYGKVFCAYMFLMFIWPSVVFGKHLKNKDKIYRFSFCVTVQIVNVNSVVLILGLFHILNRWLVIFIFYGIFIASVLKRTKLQQWLDGLRVLYRIVTGTYGLKLFLYRSAEKIRLRTQNLLLKIRNSIRPRFPEYAVLGVIILYGMIYFSYGVFQDFSYGFGDMYVHHQWIDGLLDGKIFYDGIYPEGMHCFIYCLNVLFGIRLYNCILLLAGIHVLVFLISAYALLREIFQWKYTPFFILAMFLTVDLMCVNEVYGMSRLQWMIPQDFGMYTQFLCALFLIRYLKSSHSVITKNRLRGFIWNENLLGLMMALAASIEIHFYCTIMAFLLCVSFAVFTIRKLLKKERFFPLAAAVFCGFWIAVMPMAVAYVSGTPLQGSLFWAADVINNEGEKITEEDISGDENISFQEKLGDIVSVIYWNGYVELYRKKRADWIVGFTGLAVVLWGAYRAIRLCQRFRTKRKQEEKYFNGYLPVILSSLLLMIVYVSPALGIPQLMADSRICTTEQMLLLAVMAMPADMIFTLLGRLCADLVLQAASVVATVGIYFFTMMTGTYHGYLYCELSRYNAAVEVTDSIINNFPQDSYTIVSTTDELYQVNRYGRHEELVTFVRGIDTEEYKLPTEYVFVYIEKKPIEYGQSHLFQGPAWLGDEKYMDLYEMSVATTSQCPEISVSYISAEEARKEIKSFKKVSSFYRNLESRTILESKAYLWCQNFMKLFPFEMRTYYEDENFVCYYFKQNPHALYNLAIDGWSQADGVEW